MGRKEVNRMGLKERATTHYEVFNSVCYREWCGSGKMDAIDSRVTEDSLEDVLCPKNAIRFSHYFPKLI